MQGQRLWGTGGEGAHGKVVSGRCKGRGCPCPSCWAAAQKLCQEPGHGGWPWKPFSRAASQKSRNPTPSLGPTSQLLGLLGGSSGREGPRPARSPRLPSWCMAWSAEEMPQSSWMIFWVNRVYFDLGFKTPFQGASEETLKDSWGRRGKGFSWPVLFWHRLDVLQ